MISFTDDPCSDGGIYYYDMSRTGSYRSFRREDPLPGQTVSFINAVIPFGLPAIHPTSGDTCLTAYFTIKGDGEPRREKGVYVYDRKEAVMRCISDTTASSKSLPSGRKWTDFSNNVVVSEAGVFFKGVYERGQGIYQYANNELVEVVGNPESTTVPGRSDKFTNYRAVTVNNDTVFFVGEWAESRGVYACDLRTRILRTVIESGDDAPKGGTFVDFAIEPKAGIFGNSMAANEVGNIVLIAAYVVEETEYRGVFLLKRFGDDYTPQLIVRSGTDASRLLGRVITDFNTVAINQRSEIAFTVANADSILPYQGLVFYRDEVEGMRSVFKPGDTCISELTHPSSQYMTTKHSGMIAGSQALDSAPIPRVFFRSAYSVDNGSEETPYSVMALTTLNPYLSQPK
ncbi:MAG: hypothetical protein E6J90_42915 [Deltaproteobacteria bacterium]|nr:MAG: hypothetical protein E6J90_42915 [Deltaproteobacteria bacterium]